MNVYQNGLYCRMLTTWQTYIVLRGTYLSSGKWHQMVTNLWVMEDWTAEETTGDFWEAASLSLVCVAETQECDLPSVT